MQRLGDHRWQSYMAYLGSERDAPVADKRQACTMFFLNPRGEVLLLLRDNKPGIPYPNTWDLPGGHVKGAKHRANASAERWAKNFRGWISVIFACMTS